MFLILTILAIPFSAFSLFTVGGKDIPLSYLLVLLVLINIMMESRRKDFRIVFPRENYFLVLFISLLLFSNGFRMMASGDYSLKTFTQLLNYVLMALSYLLFVNYFAVKDMKLYKRCLWVFIGFSTVLALFTFFQFAGFFLDLPQFDYFRNSNLYKITINTDYSSGWSQTPRVYGVAAEPSFWAAYILVPICLLLPLLLKRGGLLPKIIFLCLNASFFLTFSRTGYLAYVGSLIMGYFTRKKDSILIWFIFFLIIGGLLFSNLILGFLQMRVGDRSFMERLYGQTAALTMITRSPLLGVGLGKFENNLHLNQAIPPSAGEQYANYAYNFYLRITAENGLLGVAPLFIFLWLLYAKLRRLETSTLAGDKVWLAKGLKISYFSMLFSWVNIEGFNFMYIWFIFALISALPLVIGKEAGKAIQS